MHRREDEQLPESEPSGLAPPGLQSLASESLKKPEATLFSNQAYRRTE